MSEGVAKFLASAARVAAEKARATPGYAGVCGKSVEWRRIEQLPVREIDLEQVEDLTARYSLGVDQCKHRVRFLRGEVKDDCELCADGKSPTLRPVQSAFLLEAERGGGLLASAGVGSGKELGCLLLPHAFPNARRVVILTKPRLKSQMIDVDIPRYGRHFRLPLDRITVVSYSELSTAKNSDLLERLAPDLLILNEAHAIRNASAARTKRFSRYLKAHPETIVCALSGSMANDSPRDFAHIAEHALRGGAPVPLNFRELQEWSAALEEPGGQLPPTNPGAIADLMGWRVRDEEETKHAEKYPGAAPFTRNREIARAVFRRRMIATPGVVATETGAWPGSIELHAVRVEYPEVIREALSELRRTWKIGEEELRDAKDIARYERQLLLGFYYVWDWGPAGKDTRWLWARAEWRKVVREVLLHRSREGRDSPLLVANAAERGELRPDEQTAWEEWKAVKDQPAPPVVPVWLSTHAVDHALAWMHARKQDAPGVCWYEHQAFGEALAVGGATVFGAGDDSILQFRGNACAASIASHGEGKNLQHFCRALVVNPPSSGSIWEQVIGRHARPGQKSGDVVFDVLQIGETHRRAMQSAIADAKFQEQSLGQRQKLLAATRVGF